MLDLDFNRDGKSDLLITHMGSPSALLVNQTETENHWLNFQLVGTESERDAIGAQVTVHAGDKVWANWIVGGDGYLCRNEATVSFGLGDVTSIDRVVVRWHTVRDLARCCDDRLNRQSRAAVAIRKALRLLLATKQTPRLQSRFDDCF